MRVTSPNRGLESPQNPQAGKLLCRKDLIRQLREGLLSSVPPHPGPPIYANGGEGGARRVARRLPQGFAGDMPGIRKVSTEQLESLRYIGPVLRTSNHERPDHNNFYGQKKEDCPGVQGCPGGIECTITKGEPF